MAWVRSAGPVPSALASCWKLLRSPETGRLRVFLREVDRGRGSACSDPSKVPRAGPRGEFSLWAVSAVLRRSASIVRFAPIPPAETEVPYPPQKVRRRIRPGSVHVGDHRGRALGGDGGPPGPRWRAASLHCFSLALARLGGWPGPFPSPSARPRPFGGLLERNPRPDSVEQRS